MQKGLAYTPSITTALVTVQSRETHDPEWAKIQSLMNPIQFSRKFWKMWVRNFFIQTLKRTTRQ